MSDTLPCMRVLPEEGARFRWLTWKQEWLAEWLADWPTNRDDRGSGLRARPRVLRFRHQLVNDWLIGVGKNQAAQIR